jgi:hypothetical protein
MFLFCSVFEKELSGYFDLSRRRSRQSTAAALPVLFASTAKTSFCTPAKRVATAALLCAREENAFGL